MEQDKINKSLSLNLGGIIKVEKFLVDSRGDNFDLFKDTEIYPWQQELMKHINNKSEREVYWIVGQKTNKGKSYFRFHRGTRRTTNTSDASTLPGPAFRQNFEVSYTEIG